jgi:hypothetical protein
LGLDSRNDLQKFGRVYTCAPELYENEPNCIPSPPYVNWGLSINAHSPHPGKLYDFDFLSSVAFPPEKRTSLVTINSSINDLPGHKLRADFIESIALSGLNFELYGSPLWSRFKQYKGRAEDGKWPVYSRAKYVLVIENETADYYWSEKFTDALLCFCVPIYYGSPKISKYFPENSYIPLDIRSKSAVRDISSILNSDFYENNITNVVKARRLVLEKHNLLNFIDNELAHDLNR